MDFNSRNIKLIVGLGNPDEEYENTYHNVGHLAVDFLNEELKTKNQGIKTNVYMNESGRFVNAALKKYRLKPEELLIIHDDSDIELGKYKLSFGRGSAGHKGIQSIISALGDKNFWRLRIGIRPINEKIRRKAEKIVLKTISKTDKETLRTVFEEAEILF